MTMAHFDPNTALRTRRTLEYDSFTVLSFEPNCTHIHAAIKHSYWYNQGNN